VGADLELNALTNRKPVKEASDERRDRPMGELWDTSMRRSAVFRTDYSLDALVDERPMHTAPP